MLPGLSSFSEVPLQGFVTHDLTSPPSRKPFTLRSEPDAGPREFVSQQFSLHREPLYPHRSHFMAD